MKHFTFWWTMWMWVHLQRPQPKGLVKGLQIPPAFYCLKENSFCEQQYATKLYNDRHWQWSETRFPNFFTVECWKGTSLGSITQKSKSNKNPQCLSQNKKTHFVRREKWRRAWKRNPRRRRRGRVMSECREKREHSECGGVVLWQWAINWVDLHFQ